MSTRGFIGFVVDGETKIGYNHFDSYPSHLGVNVLEWLRGVDHGEARDKAKALRLVDGEGEPSPDEVARYGQYRRDRPQVAEGRAPLTWYDVLRDTAGDPAAALDVGAMVDGSRYGGQEWGYLVDFDAGEFAVYRGAHDSGQRLHSWPLASLPTRRLFLARVDPAALDEGDDEEGATVDRLLWSVADAARAWLASDTEDDYDALRAAVVALDEGSGSRG